MMLPTLDSQPPYLVAANVRAPLDAARILIGPGLGVTGDLVLGTVEAGLGMPVRILDQEGFDHRLSSPCNIVAVLGARDASTGLSATLPSGGLSVRPGMLAHWVGGESGLIGCLERAPLEGSAADIEFERPRAVALIGLLHDATGRKLNIRDLVVPARARHFDRPVLLVGATASEAGKTTLIGKVIRELTARGLRVGTIKPTGTGGVLDCTSHREHGAAISLDQVDAGLITTHCGPAEVAERLPVVFHRLQDAGVDAVVVELGGDLIGANNPVVFGLDEVRNNARLMAVVCNDALAALGVQQFNAMRLGFPSDRIRYFTSPFRNHFGQSRRMAKVGITESRDPSSDADVLSLVEEFVAVCTDVTPSGSEGKDLPSRHGFLA